MPTTLSFTMEKKHSLQRGFSNCAPHKQLVSFFLFSETTLCSFFCTTFLPVSCSSLLLNDGSVDCRRYAFLEHLPHNTQASALIIFLFLVMILLQEYHGCIHSFLLLLSSYVTNPRMDSELDCYLWVISIALHVSLANDNKTEYKNKEDQQLLTNFLLQHASDMTKETCSQVKFQVKYKR